MSNLNLKKKKKKKNQQYEKKITFNSTLSKIISFMLSLLGAFEQVYKTKCKEGIESVKKYSLLPHTKEVNGSTRSIAKKMEKEEIICFFFYTYTRIYIYTYIYIYIWLMTVLCNSSFSLSFQLKIFAFFVHVSIISHSLNLFPLS